VVIADAARRTHVVGQPTVADTACVVSVNSIGPPDSWPSVTHLSGLKDADGLVLPGCRAELHGDRIELTIDQVSGDAATQLWEYAVRWLPGTIVSAARVRAAAHGTPSLDAAQPRLAVTAPLAPRDRALAPIVATDLAGRLLAALALDYPTERAS
jgi:plasmid stability protein